MTTINELKQEHLRDPHIFCRVDDKDEKDEKGENEILVYWCHANDGGSRQLFQCDNDTAKAFDQEIHVSAYVKSLPSAENGNVGMIVRGSPIPMSCFGSSGEDEDETEA